MSTIFLLESDATREVVAAEPERVLAGGSVLIDEWQLVPGTWNAVRRAAGDPTQPGPFLLTGSASTANPGTHTGAGRIVRVRMRPMTLGERGVETPTVSLGGLLGDTRQAVQGSTAVTLDTYVEEICRSGFPAIRQLAERALRAQLAGYVNRVIDRDIPDATGRAVRNQPALRRWLAAYGAATATTAMYETIRDSATAGEADKSAKSTTIQHRDALEALFLLDPVAAWLPSMNHMAKLAAAPKHHLVDPALAVELLGVGPDALLGGEEGAITVARDGSLVGALFESLVTLCVRVFAQGAEARLRHLRTQRGTHEVNLIVERRDGRVVALEVKLSGSVGDDDVRHLLWLRDRIGDHLLDAAVITTGPDAYRRADGIAVIPAALLGP